MNTAELYMKARKFQTVFTQLVLQQLVTSVSDLYAQASIELTQSQNHDHVRKLARLHPIASEETADLAEQPYWLCCGSTDPAHDTRWHSCLEGDTNRRWGTRTQHRQTMIP